METENKKLKFSWLDLVSNTEGSSVSATGLCGTLIIMIALIVFVASVIFYFCNVAEASNIFTIINSATTILGIGAGVLGVRRISSDFGPNNRITIGSSADGERIISRKLYSSAKKKAEEEDVEDVTDVEDERETTETK